MDPTVPPLTPDRPTAQQWAEDELSKAAYGASERSNGSNLANWLQQRLEDLLSPAVGSIPLVWILVGAIVVAAAIAVAWYALGPARQARDRQRASTAVLEDDHRSAAQIRAAATAAADAGDWLTATLERFRAIIRGFEERKVIDDRPGRTAYEAARDAGSALPSYAKQLQDASRIFDGACYGHLVPERGDYESLTALEAETRDARATAGAGL